MADNSLLSLPLEPSRAIFRSLLSLLLGLLLANPTGCTTDGSRHPSVSPDYRLTFDTSCHPWLQVQLENIDATLRTLHGLSPDQVDVGLLDLQSGRLAMIHPDRIEYAASVAKIGILLAWFDLHSETAKRLSSQTRHELGLMIKVSSNEMATKYSRELGLAQIQQVLNRYGFYDAAHGGGLWMGKHYGADLERHTDPVGGHSHGATVRQLLRFYLLLEQGQLVSPGACQTMRDIFASPDIPHEASKFVKGLAGRKVQVLRKSGSWQDWLHDTAVVIGPDRHYVLVGLTHHDRGDDYLADLATAVDNLLARP